MALFIYKAVDAAGASAGGTIEAESRSTALSNLLDGGFFATELREASAPAATERKRRTTGRVPSKHITAFTRQLATMIGADIGVVPSLEVLSQQVDHGRLRDILLDVRDEVRDGSTFCDALAAYPAVFPRLYTTMVRVGEASGTLDTVLARLADLAERQDEIRGTIHSALAYPVFVLTLALASGVFLMTFVMPKLTVMFQDVERALPWPTRVMMAIGDFMTEWWLAVAVGLLALPVAFRAIRAREAGRAALDWMKLRIPVFGKVLRKLAVARFARALGTLARCGVSIVQSLEIVAEVAGNVEIAKPVREATERIHQGDSLAEPLRASGVFPPMAVHMVAVGEKTGRLDEMLLKLAEAYDRETETAVKTLTSLLAPALILVVGALVGFMILAMLLPIFEMHQLVR